MKRFKTETSAKMSDEEMQTIETLLYYPSLEKVFDREQPQNLSDMKQKMQVTVTELERVVRRGTRAEAEKASAIIAAYQTTVGFLEELERLRKGQSEEISK